MLSMLEPAPGSAASEPALAVPAGGLLGLLGQIRMVVAQLKLYPKDSPQVVKVAGTLYENLAAHLEDVPRLDLGATPDGLLVDGKAYLPKDPVAATLAASLVTALQEARVRGISIHRGVGSGELVTFLHAFAQKFWEEQDGKEVNRRLHEAGVEKITVDEVQYVAVGKEDLVLRDASQKLRDQGLNVEDFIQTVDLGIEAAADSGTCAEARMAVLKKVLEQDPSLLRRLQGSDSPAARLEDALCSLPFETLREALGRVSEAARAAPPETANLLREIGRSLVGGLKNNARLIGPMREALSASSPDLIPDWMRTGDAPGEAPAVHRTNTILQFRPALQAEALGREGVDLIRELQALGRRDLSDKVFAVLGAGLGDSSQQRRRQAAASLLALEGSIDSCVDPALRERFESQLRKNLESEKDPLTYTKMAELASFMADSRLKQGRVNEALKILDILKKHSMVKDAAFPERSSLVRPSLERVTSGPGYKQVAESMKGADPVEDGLVKALDAAALTYMVNQVKNIEGHAERARLAETIAGMGLEAARHLVAEVRRTTVPSEALRLLEILPTALTPEMAEETLTELLRHPVTTVRRRAARLLAEHNFTRSGEVLAEALRAEKDPASRAAFAEALAVLGNDSAVSTLTEALASRNEPDMIRIVCCAALGRIGNEAAVPVLAGLVSRGPRGLTRMFRAQASPTVRMAAVQALAVFFNHAEAKAAITEASEDEDAGVRSLALKMLLFPAQRPTRGAPLPSKPEATPAPRETARLREALPVEPVPEAVKAAPAKLSGSLAEVAIDQICQLIGSSGKTGLLLLKFEGSEARIYFNSGDITAVDFNNRRDQEAFNSFIRLKNGHFIFQPGEQPAQKRVRIPVHHALLEAFRVADESEKRKMA